MTLIRPFESRDTKDFLNLWNSVLFLDEITLNIFERKVLLDINREPDSLVVAELDEMLVGFALRLVLTQPIENVGLIPDDGYITAFVVHPDYRLRGIGSELLNDSIEFFKKRDRKRIRVGYYPSNYIIPGIDKENYSGGIRFFEHFGFKEYIEAFAIDAPISKFTFSQKHIKKEKELLEQRIEIRPYRREDLLNFLNFLNGSILGNWVGIARKNLINFTRGLYEEDCIFLALDKGQIIGFCQHEGSRSGPIGVLEEYKGKGIGTVLRAKILASMRKKGYHCAWSLWTSRRHALGIFARLGYTITRKFSIMEKNL